MKLIAINNADMFMEIEAQQVVRSLTEKLRSAAKKLAFWIGLAMVSVFLPVLHFVLVPTFLLIAIVSFVREVRIDNRLLVTGNYQCLKCHLLLAIPNTLVPGQQLTCNHCFQKYILSRDPLTT